MRKLKLLLLLCALFGTGSLLAQNYVDVTSTALKNPSFELQSEGINLTEPVGSDAAPYGWTISTSVQSKISSSATTSIEFTNGAGGILPKEGSYFYESKMDWKYGSQDGSISTITNSIEPGLYYVEFWFKAADICNNSKWENGTALGLTVTDASSNNLVNKEKIRVAYSLSNAGGSPGSDAFLTNSQWDRMGAMFYLEEAGAVTITVNQTLKSRAHSEIIYDNFKLYRATLTSSETKLDVSGVINNANFATNGKLNWTDESSNIALGGLQSNYCAERWNQTFNLNQNITGLPNGKYKLAIQAFYRAGGKGNTNTTQNAILYAGTDEQPVMNILTGGRATSGDGFSTQAGSVYVPNSMDEASQVFSAGAYSDNYLTTNVTDGTKKVGIKKTVGISDDWTLFDNFQLYLVSPAIQYFAEAFPVGGSLTAGKWYCYNVAIDNDYKFITADLSKVVFTQDGAQSLEDAATTVTTNPTAVQALSAGMVYVKSSEDLTLTIAPNTYTYSLGEGTLSVADGKYTQSKTLTVTFDAATTDDPDGAISILDASKIKVNGVAAAASITGKVLTITLASTLATSTDYAVSVEAGAVGYNVDNTNAAISLTAKTPAVFDGTYFIATTDGTRFISRGGDSNTEATLDEFGIPAEITTDADNVSLVRFVDANLYLYAGSKSVYTDKTTAAGGDNVKWTIAAYSSGYSFYTGRDRSSEENKGNYVAAGTGAESSKDAATYAESAYAWTLVSSATHAALMATYKDVNAATVATAAGLSATTVAALETSLSANFTSSDVSVTEAYSSPQDKYQTYGDVMAKQTLTDLKSGIYKVTLYGYQRMTWNEGTYAGHQNDAEALTAYLYANDEKIQLPSVMSEYNSSAYTAGDNPNYSPVDGKNYPNSKEAGGQAFDAGRYKVEVFALVTDGTLNIGVYSPSKYTNGNWICYRSLSVTRYVFNGDYSDLNTAITSAEASIGFEAGEYAPYKNVDSMGKLATAKALYASKDGINQGAIDAVTDDLTGAVWTENVGEVNAVYDGTFAAATNDGAPAGWRSTTHELGGATHARAYVLTSGMTNFDNLEAFGQGDTRSAFFIRFDGYYSNTGTWYNYGQTTGYEMPLKASTTYCLTLQAGAWGSYANKKLSVTIKGPSDYNQKAQLTTTKKTNDGEGVDDLSFFFTTTDAGNYTLSFWNENGANYAAIVSNIELKKAVASDIDISENDDAVPTYNFGNVTLTRTLKASYWNSFSVPFDMAIPDGWTVKEFESATDNVITLKDATTIKAGEPYLVKPATDVTNPTYNNVVVKSIEGTTKGEGDYKFAAQIYNKALATDGTIAYLATDGTIKKLTSGGIKGLRAYFIIPASGSGVRISFGDETTGIRSVESQSMNNGAIYDMQGRKVTSVKKGIYVVNGKKVIK